MKTKVMVVWFLLWLPMYAGGAEVTLMVIDSNAFVAGRAAQQIERETGIPIQVAATGDLATAHQAAGDPVVKRIQASKIIVVDVMDKVLTGFLLDEIDPAGKTVYALRSSRDDESLMNKGLIFDPAVSAYFEHLSLENLSNLLRLVIQRHVDGTVTPGPVQTLPDPGIFHPDAPALFADAPAFRNWQSNRPSHDPSNPVIGLLFYRSFLTPGQQEPIERFIRELETAGFSVWPCFGNESQAIDQFLLDDQGRSRVDLVVAFSLKFSSALTPELAQSLARLDVPVLSGISLYQETLSGWRNSSKGIDPVQVAWAMATPEISGLVEPTVLTAGEKTRDPVSGKMVQKTYPVLENMARLIPRLQGWARLRQTPNSRKKVAILFYNHHQGKQNIGASYLNVFASLEEILGTLAEKGYHTGPVPDESRIRQLIVDGVRNVGSWAPGELETMVAAGSAVLLEPEVYGKWFSELPREFQDRVNAQWGRPESAGIMMHQGKLVLPLLRQGNLVLMPEPSRGWGDDPMKLYHDTTLYPHHQYIAAYLWLEKQFDAHAMIHLGTHATHEWTPGKQAGLSPACAPEVLAGRIPNLYPYIVDNVGEAIQAKRRGRGVMLSHLTPVMVRSGLYVEYSRMAELVNEIDLAYARGAVTVTEKLAELRALADSTGVLGTLMDTGMLPEQRGAAVSEGEQIPDEDLVHALGHYLEEFKERMIPHGMHTYGRARPPEQIRQMAEAVAEWQPDVSIRSAEERLRESTDQEMKNLLKGLAGRYVPPGEGNDPMRNPGALPTGRNLYGFNPDRLPSPAAWELGRQAADRMVADHLAAHGKYPEKVAVVLWAVELLRNEGINESTILWLMGIRPRWQASGRVAGLEVVPGWELGRPRIDVLINASGLYRDLFADKLLFLDEAVQLALAQTDIDNLLARNTRRMQQSFMDEGMDEARAEMLSRLRIFSETPGSYGNGISEMTGASGLWESPQQVVDVYENRMGFAFGKDIWGEKTPDLLKKNLASVDVAVHSVSSNVYGLMDNDDMFAYLGGLAMAVRHESGRDPDTRITTSNRAGQVSVEDMALTLDRELRTRYLNPVWIEGMQQEDYAGARAMNNFVEYFWGWQVTTPDRVSASQWQQIHEVYVADKYGLEMKAFFNRSNPWAYQSITARMLEAVRKQYWQADEAIQKQLAAEYVMNVVEKGVACCDHTCNNPMLNQMVVNLVSLPGVLNPDLVEQFRLAVAQSARTPLSRQVADRAALAEQLAAPGNTPAQPMDRVPENRPDQAPDPSGKTEVAGYEMEKMVSEDDVTQVTSSGVEWLAGLMVLGLIGLAALGMKRRMT